MLYLPSTNGRDCIGWLPRCVHGERGGEVVSSFLAEVYDVKFYPFGMPTDDPIFAAVGGKQVSLPPTSLWQALTDFICS